MASISTISVRSWSVFPAEAMEKFDFSKVDSASRTALGEIFEEMGRHNCGAGDL